MKGPAVKAIPKRFMVTTGTIPPRATSKTVSHSRPRRGLARRSAAEKKATHVATRKDRMSWC